MPDKVIADEIQVNGTPTLPNATGMPSKTQVIRAPATQEAVAGGRLSWWGNVPRALPYSYDDLTQDFADDIYAKMMLDPQVNACINTLKTAILSDGVELAPAVPDQNAKRYGRAQEVCDFCNSCLDTLNPSIDVVLWDLLDALAYGSKVAEQVYTLDGNQLRLSALKVKPRRATAFVVDAYMNVLGLLAQIPGMATGVTLITGTPIDPATQPNMLPRDKFVVYSNWMHDSDPRGTSLLRPAYRPWWDKAQMIPEYLKYLTQFASASIIATAPDQGVPYTVPDSPNAPLTVSDQIAQALADFRNGSYLVLPFGTQAKPIEINGEGIPFQHAFDRFDRQISTAILHQTLATQESQHETRAAAEVHQDILALLVRMGKRAVGRMLKTDVLTPLVRMNFGDAAAKTLVPNVNLSELEAEDLSPRMIAVANLANAGLILPSQLPDLYTDLDLPPASPEDLAAYSAANKPKPPAPPPTGIPPGRPTGMPGQMPPAGERNPEEMPQRPPGGIEPASRPEGTRPRGAQQPPQEGRAA